MYQRKHIGSMMCAPVQQTSLCRKVISIERLRQSNDPLRSGVLVHESGVLVHEGVGMERFRQSNQVCPLRSGVLVHEGG